MWLPILSFLIWSPVFTGCVFLLTRCNLNFIKVVSFFITLFCFIISIFLLLEYSTLYTYHLCFIEDFYLVEPIGVKYFLGVDGLALPLLSLNCFITLLVIVFSFNSVFKSISYYYSAFLIMEGFVNGVFCAVDAIVFYIFFEAMLIPMFIIIGIWGGYNRIYATLKFFLYTFFGSIFLLLGIIYLHTTALEQGVITDSSFSLYTLGKLILTVPQQKCLFWLFFIAFAIKIPMWPFHTWLPDAHVEAPTAGSVILAGVLLKLGTYGIIRFILPILPIACFSYGKVVILLSLIAIIFIGFIAIVQNDLKKLIAYSSIAHMGFVTLGFFLSPFLLQDDYNFDVITCIQASFIQMISHGFISSALFFSVGTLYIRLKTKDIRLFGGIAKKMPIFSVFFMCFVLGNVGLPGTSGFVGEFLIILESFKLHLFYAFFAGLTIILSACYTLWMYKRVMFGSIQNKAILFLFDLTIPEKTVYSLLLFSIVFFGIWPKFLIDIMFYCAENISIAMADGLGFSYSLTISKLLSIEPLLQQC